MTTEKLLKPRYKVIADYPSNCVNVVTIYYLQDGIAHTNYELFVKTKEGLFLKHELDDYPHLFQLLQWWE